MENAANKVNISGSISRTSLYNKSARILKKSEIDVCNDNLSISVFPVHGEILSSVTQDQQHIPRNNKRKKTPDTSITGKEIIQEPDNPSKRSKEDSIPDLEKIVENKHLHLLIFKWWRCFYFFYIRYTILF